MVPINGAAHHDVKFFSNLELGDDELGDEEEEKEEILNYAGSSFGNAETAVLANLLRTRSYR